MVLFEELCVVFSLFLQLSVTFLCSFHAFSDVEHLVLERVDAIHLTLLLLSWLFLRLSRGLAGDLLHLDCLV